MSLRAAAAALDVSPATAHRWWHRRRAASAGERRLGRLAGRDRSSRPHRQPRRLSPAEEEPILRARRETGLGPGRLAGICRRARSTIWKVLHRHGLSRRGRGERQSFRRYEWSRPGALLHVDMAQLARFERPGHAVTGDRARTAPQRAGVGYVYLHCVVDDHSRYAYVEQHGQRAREIAAAVLRAGDRALRRARARAARGGDDRQRLRLPQVARLSGPYSSGSAPAKSSPRLHAALERQGRALHPDAQARVGLRPLLAELARSLAGLGILRSLLQPAKPPQLAGRPAADQPRSQRAWAGHLGAGERLVRAGSRSA